MFCHIDQSTLNSIKLLNSQDRVTQLRLNHVFKIFNGTSPSYLCKNFIRAATAHSHNTRSSSYNFIVPGVKGIAKKTFYYNAILNWNDLPAHIQSNGNLDDFKKAAMNDLAAKALKRESDDFVRV